MPDYLGRVPIPAPVSSGVTFTLVTEYGYGMSQDWTVVEHRFGELATMAVQRYGVGSGARHFQWVKSVLSYADRQYLLDFYDTVQGSFQSFTYPAPNADRTSFTNYEVCFDVAPLSVQELTNRAQSGLTFVEVIDPDDAPTYTVTDVATRFPVDADGLQAGLASDVQVIIPLIHIRMRGGSSAPDWDAGTAYTAGQIVNYNAIPYVAIDGTTGNQPDTHPTHWRGYDIYVSDRRLNVIGFPGAPSDPDPEDPQPLTFLPRLLNMGVPGTADVIMSQSLDGRADNVRFVFGNADRAMTALINDTSIEFADIEMSFLHVGTGILLQLWKGVVLSWQSDGTAQFSVQCSDGLYPITQSYPPRTVSRQCWKPFDRDVVPGYRPCPWSTEGGGFGNPDTCDYFFNSDNGCLSHHMSRYFGGHPEQPQSVVIKDSGTGILNFFKAHVTSTSILSDSIWGKPLAEIWCNSHGSPQRAYWAECMVAAVREESEYQELLGIVGAGPIGAFEGMSIQTNGDGYKFVVAPTADGFFPQGFKVDGDLNIKDYQPTYGLRQSTGNDPLYQSVAVTEGIDAFSLGQGTPQHWEIHDPVYGNVGALANTIIPYAAGTALNEMRYLKAAGKGLTPTTAESHNMQCPIRQGLSGSVFNTDNTRSTTAGITNPFWVAANTYYRALGIQQADEATQLAYIVRESITNIDEMGCADIADLLVDPIVGSTIPAIPYYTVTPTGEALSHYNLDHYNNTFSYTTSADDYTDVITISIADAITAGYVINDNAEAEGKEIQFEFQGALTEFKPFRDWMTEILNCALGYYCFEFGKLRLGIRYSAVPTDSFTVGSMLYQSLAITPIQSQFEYLRVSFANVALQYQQDLAEYQDKDHAAYFGRAGRPLTSDMRSVGCSSLSQGLRIAITRTREEIGGIMRDDLPDTPYIEWDNHKRVSFKSTLLALDNEIGQVVAIKHIDLPTYPGAHPDSRPGSNPAFEANTWPFRIQKWMLHSDWSVSIMADSCVDSMYDTLVGPQPMGVGPRPLPIMFFPEPLGQWAPYQQQADALDALWPSEWTFNLGQQFSYKGDGKLQTYAIVVGLLPVNQFVPNCGAVDVKKGNVSWSSTGGFIPGGTTLFVQICAAVAVGVVIEQYSPPSEVLVLKVPVGTDTNSLTINHIKWPPVAALNSWVLFANTIEDLICGQESDLGLPTTITYNGPTQRQTYAVPDFDLGRLRLRAQVLIHGGVLGATVDSLTTSTIVSQATIDLSSIDDWTGRVLAIIGRQTGDGFAPWAHFLITAWDVTTGTYTLDRDPMAAGVQPDDVFTVCFLGYDNSATPRVIGDPGLSNSNQVPPHTGEAIDDPNRIGRMVRVIAGTSRGLYAKIVSNTATEYTLDRDLVIDETSVWVVCDAGWTYSKDVVVNNADPTNVTFHNLEINNYNRLNLLVEGVTIDREGVVINDKNACVRMLFVPGVQGTTNVTA